MPTGFVKSMIQASLAASRETCSAICKITGTVRSALASPPAPVVSWPTQPHCNGRALVDRPRRLTTNPQLEENDCGI